MKRLILMILSAVMLLSVSACATPTPIESPTLSPTFTPTPTPAITAMSELSEIEVSELLRQHITPDMSHEDVFSKLEALGFDLSRDIYIANTASSVYDYLIYTMGDVAVSVGLDMEYHVDLKGDYSITSYKSDQVTINGVSFIGVHWNSYLVNEPDTVPDRVAEQRIIQSTLNDNVKEGDDLDTAIELIEGIGFVLVESYNKYYRYQYGNYDLRIFFETTSLAGYRESKKVNRLTLMYDDYLFDKRSI